MSIRFKTAMYLTASSLVSLGAFASSVEVLNHNDYFVFKNNNNHHNVQILSDDTITQLLNLLTAQQKTRRAEQVKSDNALAMKLAQEEMFKSDEEALQAALKASLATPLAESETSLFKKNLGEAINKLRPVAEDEKNLFAKNLKQDDAFLNEVNSIKANLKHVNESQQNQYAKSLKNARDPYNAEMDLKSFVQKLRINDGFVFKNDTDQVINLRVKLEDKDKKHFFNIKKISIQPDQFFVMEQAETTLHSIKILNNPGKYLNPKFTEDAHLQINIEDQQDKFFLHQHHHFDFKSKKYSDEELNAPGMTEEERHFRSSFNSHLDYVNHVFAKDEGTTLEEMDAQRQELYSKNNIGALLKKNPALLDSAEVKIPSITHKIWVTSDDKPTTIPNYYLKWIENSAKHNKVEDGWMHCLWVERKDKLPELAKMLENHPTIKLMELDGLDNFVTGDLYKEAIRRKKFGKASDILRLEILRQFGGFYLDTDYEVFQSLKPYSKAYDLIMGLEPMSALLCNAFIGARPNHDVINKALEMINRNHDPKLAPSYITDNSDEGWKTIVETGPALVTAAFKHAAGKIGNTDIVLPPQLIYPTPENVYPKKEVVKPNGPIPAEALGAHYWETAWMRAEFGSEG